MSHYRDIHDCIEVFATAAAVLGQSLPNKLAKPEQILVSTERNKGVKLSMLLGWEARRPLELEGILGNPVRMVRERGYEISRFHTLYAVLRSAQSRRNDKREKAEGRKGSEAKP
jgi:2-dehydropantoate 2-reductase